MGSNREEVQVFSTSFLDLLSCGMGAVIILLIIFISQLEVESQDSTPFVIVTITVEDASEFPGTFSESLSVSGEKIVKPEETAMPSALQYRSGGAWVRNSPIGSTFTATIQQSGDPLGELTYTPKELSPPSSGETLPYKWLYSDGTESPVYNTFRTQLFQRRTYSLTLQNLTTRTLVSWQTKKRPWPGSLTPRWVFHDDGRVEPIGSDVTIYDRATNAFKEVTGAPPPAGMNWAYALGNPSRHYASHPLKISVSIHSSATPPGGTTDALKQEFFFVNNEFAKSENVEIRVTIDEELELKDPIELIPN